MSREYSFSKMIKEYEDGYTGQFKAIDPHDPEYDIKIYKAFGNLYYKSNDIDERLTVSIDNMRSKFYKVEKEISVEEAITAIREGKKVYCLLEEDGQIIRINYSKDGSPRAIGISKILEGKWFIED